MFNHAGLWAESPTPVLESLGEPEVLGIHVKEQLAACVFRPEFKYRERNKSEWPAYIAAGLRSMSAFEKEFARYSVRGANESNIILMVESELVNGAFTLRASINAHAPAEEIGEWLVRMHNNYLRVEAAFE
ncbi:MAG: hypothetical protein ACK46C_03960 [Flavobacteriales bacterium]